jgi:hypothetical protein
MAPDNLGLSRNIMAVLSGFVYYFTNYQKSPQKRRNNKTLR